MRPDNRAVDQMRPVAIETDISSYAEGSCMIRLGNTHVICMASIDSSLPHFLRNSQEGWVTAEYGMLPRSTHNRMLRKRAAESGRTKEIQRLIGRSLRAIIDRKMIRNWQITIDCDVLQADAGTRVASITGGYIAMNHALRHMRDSGILRHHPLNGHIAAISCAVVDGEIVLDPTYEEDSKADADANFVMSDNEEWIDIQISAEGKPFSDKTLKTMMLYAKKGLKELFDIQKQALSR